MKSKFYLALMAIAAIAFTSCSNDDDDKDNNEAPEVNGGGSQEEKTILNPLKVFTSGLPKSYDNNRIQTNEDGLVVRIVNVEYGTVVNFLYSEAWTREYASDVPDVVMTIDDDSDEKITCNLYLNKDGFVSHCLEVYEYHGQKEYDTWDFTYNSDGQLTSMLRSEGGNEKTQIKYEDGNIVEVTMNSKDDADVSNHCKIYYTSDKTPAPIENKGCVMLFDNTLGIDMDEMEYAYYAGLLGKATKHLPVRCVDLEDNYTDVYQWTIDDNGYPTKVSYPYHSIAFTW